VLPIPEETTGDTPALTFTEKAYSPPPEATEAGVWKLQVAGLRGDSAEME
jgi:hypothetical protein